MEKTRVCGKLERITERIYGEGKLNSTLFEIQTEGRTEEYDFYGEIPEEFVGRNIAYSFIEKGDTHKLRVEQTISVGELSRKPNGEYFLEPQNPAPAIPHTVKASKDWNYKKSQS